ncbi:MAG TPA: T9SS type A sorting domain-containing protein, partial [Ignavibacteria bacterium]|nr:T9SS type A sorting domain-containing protein [Ignavibacteria bacterium]
TTNQGATWINDNSGTNTELIDVYFPSSARGWTVGAGGVIKYRGAALGITGISSKTPEKFSLSQNYPNPFNPETKFKFAVANTGSVNINVYDAAGKLVENLVNGNYSAGVYEVSWNAVKYTSGVYFYTIVTSEFTETKKMLLVK